MDLCRKEDYIQATIQSVRPTRSTAVGIVYAVAQACEKHGIHRVLLRFVNTELAISISEAYELAKIAKNLRLLVSKIAIVVEPGPIDKDTRFFETAAASVGLRCRFFEIEEEALSWLRTRG